MSVLHASLPSLSSGFQPFTSQATFQALLSVWWNLDTQNSADLRILTEPVKESADIQGTAEILVTAELLGAAEFLGNEELLGTAEPRLKNTVLESAN